MTQEFLAASLAGLDRMEQCLMAVAERLRWLTGSAWGCVELGMDMGMDLGCETEIGGCAGCEL